MVLSAGYDGKIKYWNTETGEVLSTLSTEDIPYVVKLKPDGGEQNIVLAGMSDNKIVQWDLNTRQITQEYDGHLGAVRGMAFADSNKSFVTCSDDESLRVWEFGIPKTVKYICEPHMHSMRSISAHPDGNHIAAQSRDNQIRVYRTTGRFELIKNKRFSGHFVGGYASQVNFSQDGTFVSSGDGHGKCWVWNWSTCKVVRTLECHDGVCIGTE